MLFCCRTLFSRGELRQNKITVISKISLMTTLGKKSIKAICYRDLRRVSMPLERIGTAHSRSGPKMPVAVTHANLDWFDKVSEIADYL